MEENEKQENEKGFKTVQNPNTYKTIYTADSKNKSKTGFGKSVLLPFFSGVVGCAVVLRYMFWGTIYPFKNIRFKF